MSMFARLFLLIGLVSGVSLGVVAGLLWRNSVELERQLSTKNSQAGQEVLKQGTRLLEANLRSTHSMIVREKARKVEAYFVSIADALQLEATLVQQFLGDQGSLAQAPPLFEGNELTRRVKASPALRRTLVGAQRYAMFHLAPGVRAGEALPAMNRLRRLGGFFAHTQKALAGCDSSYFGSEQGFILGYPGGLSFFKPSYDPRRRPWYQKAMQQGKLIWIVDTDRSGDLLLTCARPVALSPSARPVGVAAIDMKLVLDDMFNVESKSGGLKVSRALLVDEAGHVRVSASWKNGRPVFDNNVLSSPPVSTLAGFAQAYARSRARPAEHSGIFFEGPEMAGDKSVFIYSNVSFSTGSATSAGGKAAADDWRYIVQVPLAPLLAPIHSVTNKIQSSTRDISQAIKQRTRQLLAMVLALIGATLLAAISVAYFAARATSRPLMQMARVARGVGAGNLEQQALESSGGEIGELGRAINAMISGLKQRDLLKETFGRYVAPAVVDEVLREGNIHLGGVKRVVTIFFSDLEGFTTLSEVTPPETLISWLNEYFEAMTSIILGSEGTLDKYIGDAILAFWGEPIAHQDDAARACRVALEQFEQLRRLCEKWALEGRPRLNMRIGIETGEVIVGNVGSDLKTNYTVLGDTVNFASRLEAVNKVYGTRILIGEETRLRAGSAIEVREVDLLAVAGKKKPVRVYELLGMAGKIPATRRAGYALYEQGLHAYRERDWDQAEQQLKAAQAALGSDKPSQVLLERIARCRLSPPPPGWDGGAILEHK